jgi:pimeloyl-ACP methyl ester carboxylesterase
MELRVDGRKVFAATGGKPFDPKLPAIVFIHGASFDHTVWVLQARWFAWHGRAVLAVDLPGHGRSEGPLLDTVPAMADWTIRLLGAAGVKQAALAGHSMGSLVALDAAARFPERVSKIAMLGAAYPIRVNDELLASARADEHLSKDLINAWGFGRAAQLGQHRVPGLWMMRGGLRTLEQSGEGVLYNDLAACNAWTDGEARAAAVKCPALFVLGERDMMTPVKSGEALAAKLKADVVVLPGVGHIMMEEAPDETLDALRRFL